MFISSSPPFFRFYLYVQNMLKKGIKKGGNFISPLLALMIFSSSFGLLLPFRGFIPASGRAPLLCINTAISIGMQEDSKSVFARFSRTSHGSPNLPVTSMFIWHLPYCYELYGLNDYNTFYHNCGNRLHGLTWGGGKYRDINRLKIGLL
jgi:hypothetical protein